MVGVAVGKMMMVGLLFKYRNNPSSLITQVDFIGLRFRLDANPNNNPVSKLFEAWSEDFYALHINYQYFMIILMFYHLFLFDMIWYLLHL